MNSKTDAFKNLPSVDKLLQSEILGLLIARVGHESVKLEARSQLESLRSRIAEADESVLQWVGSEGFLDDFCSAVQVSIEAAFSSSLVPVINLTGTVVHTNLGRARLPLEAIAAIQLAATQTTNLEYDLETGTRGDRDSHIESKLCNITGAEAATVVNNNAAAVLLVLNSLAFNKEVLISRGELVEIGGAFRIPDVMKSAGCTLKEIGTTNRTHLRDYESALSDQTALLMKVHTSNYEIRGFVNSVSESELSELAGSNELPFVSDLGSGTLVDLEQFGLPHETTVQESLQMGADIVTFSGDKLLGGPQAGIIVGRADLIRKIKANPLKRALRVDKITLAALAEVINLYQDSRRLSARLPLLVDLTRPLKEIEAVAAQLLPIVQAAVQNKAKVVTNSCQSQIGSGSLPLDLVPSVALEITPVAEKGQTDAMLIGLALAFRKLPKPVIGRIHDGKLIFDLRCLTDSEEFEHQLTELDIVV
jgi:L-seryl-tRNA(Ser) seleniumtransferase